MKFHSVTIVFLLVVMELAEMVNGLCLVRNTSDPLMYWYQCSMSNNYLTDVEAAPVDISIISFSNTKMPVIRNRSFVRLSDGLEVFQIYYSEIGEIEDNAFQGLVKLRSFEIVGSNLRIVKGGWFKGLFGLKTISFRGNEIKRIEGSFFSIVPPLEILDISENELNCIPLASLSNFKTKLLHAQHNLFSWKCMAALVEWLKEENIHYDDFKRQNWDSSMELVAECQNILRKPHMQLNEENLKKCAEKRALELLPSKESYTIAEVCQLLKDRPSPFLDCSK